MLHCSWDRTRDGCNFYFSFWTIFCPYTEKIKILKKWKKAWRYHHFTHVYQKLWSQDVRFPRYGARWTIGRTDRERRTNRWTEKVTGVGAPSKKIKKEKVPTLEKTPIQTKNSLFETFNLNSHTIQLQMSGNQNFSFLSRTSWSKVSNAF